MKKKADDFKLEREKAQPIDPSKIKIEKEPKVKFPKKPKKGEPPVEIKQKRKRNKREYLDADGNLTVEVYAKPVFFKTKQNKWEKINNNITYMLDGNESFPYKTL